MIVRITNSLIALWLMLYCFGSSAQSRESPMPRESELRTYVNQRWLRGDSSGMLEALYYRNYQIPVSGMQLGVKKTFSTAKNAKVVEDLRIFGLTHGAVPITPAEAQRQFELWGDCLVKNYQSGLSSSELLTLSSFFGVAHFFPRLGREVDGWLFEALRRAPSKADKPAISMDMDDSVEMYSAIANPVNDIYLAQFWNLSEISQARFGIAVKEKTFPQVASRLEIDQKSWALINEYSTSRLSGKEGYIYRRCDSDTTYINPSTSRWISGSFRAMAEYFDKNKTSLSAD